MLDGECVGGEAKHRLVVDCRRQIYEPDAIRESINDAACSLQRQSRLAGSPGPGKGDQTGYLELRDHIGHLVTAADERRELERQIRGARAHAAQGGKIGPDPGDQEVVQMLGLGKVLEPVAAEITEGHTIWELRFDEASRRVGQQHLSAVPRRGDPGCPVHIYPDITCATELPFAGVQAHPGFYPATLRLRRGGKRTLGGDGCAKGSNRGRECGKE
jgi:hypothetical protein